MAKEYSARNVNRESTRVSGTAMKNTVEKIVNNGWFETVHKVSDPSPRRKNSDNNIPIDPVKQWFDNGYDVRCRVTKWKENQHERYDAGELVVHISFGQMTYDVVLDQNKVTFGF